MEERVAAWVSQYRKLMPQYDAFGKAAKALLQTLLEAHEISVHSITYRVKSPEQLAEKLTRRGKNYRALTDVTDLLGLRIVTYFEDDVDRMAKIIDAEFQVDPDRSVDKRLSQDPDRFGYRSLHKICQVAPARLSLPEYGMYRGLCCEIQIRSILQHAWAEIEHDLGYKAADGVPLHLRRRFSILAGLLELADAEFVRLRKDLLEYSANVPEAVREKPAEVYLDTMSLRTFIQESDLVTEFDARIARMSGDILAGLPHLEDLVAELQYVGIETIQDLTDALQQHRGQVFALAEWAEAYSPGGFPPPHGVCLHTLAEVLLGRRGSVEAILEALVELGLRGDHGGPDLEEHARMIQTIYSSR